MNGTIKAKLAEQQGMILAAEEASEAQKSQTIESAKKIHSLQDKLTAAEAREHWMEQMP